MTYEQADATAKVLKWAVIAVWWIGLGCALAQFTVTMIVCYVLAVAGIIWWVTLVRRLQREMRVHNLTIVTVKLDKAIANLDDSARV